MQKTFFLIVLLVIAVGFLSLFAACSGGGGDDDDDTSDDEKAIKEVVQEIIEGFLEGTEDSLNKKVFPHISEDYNYAGFDKDALKQDALEDVLSEERPKFGEPTIGQAVAVEGKKATDNADVQVDISLPWMEEDIGFEMAGKANLSWTFELQKESDGKWRVIAVKTRFSSMSVSGAEEGFEDSLPNISNLAISPTDSVAPKGSVSISGQASLDVDSYFYWGWFSLNWYDFIPNLANPNTEEDSIYYYDFTATKGNFDLSATLPDDGVPEGINIPKTLNLGDDAVQASLVIIALDKAPWEGGQIISGLFNMWFIPLESFKNKDLEACDNEPLDEENHSGIWLAHMTDAPMNQLLDFSIQEDFAIARVGFVDHDEFPPQIRLFAVSGEMSSADEAILSASFEQGCPPGDPRVIGYRLNFSGIAGSGTITVSGCGGGELALDFELQKLSNRCKYIIDYSDILGAGWTFVHPDYGNWTMQITEAVDGCYIVTLNDTLNLYTCFGLNIGWGYGPVVKNGVDYGFAFNDLQSGVAVISDYNTGSYKLGEFSR